MAHMKIRLAFPPNRESNELKKIADGSFKIGHGKLSKSLLPETVVTKYGQELKNPFLVPKLN